MRISPPKTDESPPGTSSSSRIPSPGVYRTDRTCQFMERLTTPAELHRPPLFHRQARKAEVRREDILGSDRRRAGVQGQGDRCLARRWHGHGRSRHEVLRRPPVLPRRPALWMLHPRCCGDLFERCFTTALGGGAKRRSVARQPSGPRRRRSSHPSPHSRIEQSANPCRMSPTVIDNLPIPVRSGPLTRSQRRERAAHLT